MIRAEVRLKDISAIKRFVDLANDLKSEAELSVGDYRVDAKSIMGILSMDLARTMTLEIKDDNEGRKFLEEIKEYIVE